ncbi:HTH_Tnp_Tc3_2 domain-containing protein [Trichonephila clavipes]|nr:HTH_Tnp_Tc3_2 domain-containing protein [Trichonephila clavipes]
MRDIATVVRVGKSSVSRILRKFQDSGTSSPKRKGKCRGKWKTSPRTDKILIKNSKINARKTSTDLQNDLLDYGVELGTSIVLKKLLEVSHKATNPRKVMKKRLA